MKILKRDILTFQEDDFFRPIRDKSAYARLVVCTAKHLLFHHSDTTSSKVSSCCMKLIIDRMSRVFYYNENKYFSIAFPLFVYTEESNITEIKTYSGSLLDFSMISSIIAILDSKEYKTYHSLLGYQVEPNNKEEEKGLYILEEIMQFEPSYLRYDNDPKNENGNLHPLNHIDINYSQHGTFKLGLKKTIDRDYFENLQNTKTDCSFLEDI